MIPIELELHNFLAYRDPDSLRLEGIHIACLVGPNGAGKSSLLDAITWALGGKARVSTPDDLIHQGEKEMRVALTFDQGGTRYRVIRQRKVGKRGVSLLEFQTRASDSAAWKDISEKTIRATQEEINKSVGLDYETFVNSAFLAQGRADEFTTKTPSQRKQILANILNLSRWEIYERQTKDRIAETKTSIQRLDGRVEEIERELLQREAHEAVMKEAEAAAHGVNEKLIEFEKHWADLEKARNDLVTLQRQIDDLTRRITAREREMADIKREQAATQVKADKGALQAVLDEVKEALAKLEPIQAKLQEMTQEQSTLAEETARLEGINQTLGPETEPLKARVAVLDAATEPVCPTCGQALTEENRVEMVAELRVEIETRRELYRSNRDRMLEIAKKIGEIEDERLMLDKQLKTRSTLEKRGGELEAALAYADEAAKWEVELRDKVARWSKDLVADREQRKVLEAKADGLESRLRAASLTQKDVDQLRLEKRIADERVGGARQQLAALEAFERQRIERLEERERMADDLGLYEDLREAFGKRGVPAMIIETVVPELTRSANDLLTHLSEDKMEVSIETQRKTKAGELREALDIIISDDLGERPYELYSGGEAFRIDFAIRIAISRLLARRAGAQLRSLFIDEGFGTQDARGREQLIAAINAIQDDFDRILVITHIEELKDAFPARIEITKTP
ncbi:MAG: SMC family ATPase, partial [Anaerolineales bacterium]